jgi:hypothetical protein
MEVCGYLPVIRQLQHPPPHPTFQRLRGVDWDGSISFTGESVRHKKLMETLFKKEIYKHIF